MARSFRDPGGTVLAVDGRILRIVNRSAAADLDAFLSSRTCSRFVEDKKLVRSWCPPPGETPEWIELEQGQILLEHERVPFPSFPYEWPPEMLHAAGRLTLELARSALQENLGLKDATPHNVLFRGPVALFVDVLSFERRQPGDPVWLPYAQFVRTFLLPLLADKRLGIPAGQILMSRRDGPEPEELYRWTGPLRRLSPLFLALVSIPAWLDRFGDRGDARLYRRRTLADFRKSRFVLESMFARLATTLRRLEPPPDRRSRWSDYALAGCTYTGDELAVKERFVSDALEEVRPKAVLDVGSNTGHFSEMAARLGAGVVAIDRDPVVTGRLWRKARAEELDILPLVVDFSRPSPALGWRNRECPSFLERARGSFDAVMMLAVLHHLLAAERTPLDEVIDLAAELSRDALIIEFIAPEDPLFRKLARGRDHLYRELTREAFENACRSRFDLARCERVGERSRWLYLLRKK